MKTLKYIHLFYLLTIYVLIQYGIKLIIPSNLITQLDDLLVLLLLALMIFSLVYEGNKNVTLRRTFMDWKLLGLLLLSFTSIYFNDVPLKNAVLSLKNYYLYFFLFYFIVFLKFDINKDDRVLKLVALIMLIQLPLQVLQLIWDYFTVHSIGPDNATGTMPGSNNLSYVMFFPLFYCSYLYFVHGQRKYLAFILVFSASMVLSMGRFSILLFPVIFVLYNFRTLAFRVNSLPKVLGVSAVFFGLVFVVFSNLELETAEEREGLYLFDPAYLVQYITEYELSPWKGSGRLLWFPVTYDRLNELAAHPLIGMGPGMYASYVGFKTMAPPTESIYNIFGQIELGLDPNVGSQFIPIWGELGYIGITLFVILFLAAARRYYRISRRTANLHLKALAITASASSVFMLMGFYINHVIEAQPLAFMYILSIGLAEWSYRNEKKNTIIEGHAG